MTLSPYEAYRRAIKNDPTFRPQNGVDYDRDFYVFAGPTDMYAVHKKTGTVVGFVPTTDLKKYFTALKQRPIDITKFPKR